MPLRVLTQTDEVIAARRQQLRAGQTLALVPTMGFLHDGHLSLMREGKKRADVVAVSIFVNPTQFGPREDLSKYPRDLQGDMAKCEAAGASWVFTPDDGQMYPPGFQTHVEVERASLGLCGERRPGHFRGVATVVTKLFALFRPDVALFGEKDFQQLQVIRTFNRDLNLGVDVVGLPTIREPDGLAMSSRNSYLSPAERAAAVSLSQGLFRAQQAYRQGERQVAALLGTVRAAFDPAVREDYVALVDSETLEPLEVAQDSGRLLVAAFVGKTRLIDNVPLHGAGR